VHLTSNTDDNATEYWLGLGQSVAFEGQTLIDCVHRIHVDILKVWNFHDPHEVRLLYVEYSLNVDVYFRSEFFTRMISLLNPLIMSISPHEH